MTQLSDATIRALIEDGTIGISPYNPDRVQPASLDVTVGDQWAVPRLDLDNGDTVIDAVNRDTRFFNITSPEHTMRPGDFLLATTTETIRLPPHIAAKFEGKSSLGRIGLMTHVTAGFIDPGFHGQITLELHNVWPEPIRLHAGMPIGQLVFTVLDRPTERPYGSPGLGSRYQYQSGTTGARP